MTWYRSDGTPESFQGGPAPANKSMAHTPTQSPQGPKTVMTRQGPVAFETFQWDGSVQHTDWTDMDRGDLIDSLAEGQVGFEGMGNILAKASTVGEDGHMELDQSKLAALMNRVMNDPKYCDPVSFVNGAQPQDTGGQDLEPEIEPALETAGVSVESPELAIERLAAHFGLDPRAMAARVMGMDAPPQEPVEKAQPRPARPQAPQGTQALNQWLKRNT